MIQGIYQGAASMRALERWQTAIAGNLSAGSVPGYKKDDVTFTSALSGTSKTDADDLSPDVKHYVPKAATRITDSQGNLSQTSRDLDFAVQGPGYFQVKTADGKTGFTRNGEFHVDAKGVLVNNQGAEVQGESGSIKIDQSQGAVSVDKTGKISQGENQIGKLALFDLSKAGEIRRSNDGLVAPADENSTPAKVKDPQIFQGYTEDSNVAPMQEMVNMIQVSRAYEVSQKLITSLDHTSQSAIDALGTP